MSHPADLTINSFSDALEKLLSLESGGFYADPEWPFHKFPFGLWFRGHCQDGLELTPRIFRARLQADDPGMGMWDETNIYDHLKLRVPSHEHVYHTAFDWLCLMQHYAVPTRLLDWSESILPALYFAVTNPPHAKSAHGELIVLNAKRLNRRSRARPTIASPEGYEVVVRAEMAATRSKAKLQCKPTVVAALEQVPKERNGDVDLDGLQTFLRPIAVFPRRLNERMTLQSSVFTLHGGKEYVPAMREKYGPDCIPSPISLQQVDDECGDKRILGRYLIPHDRKASIKDELFKLGVHEGTLFPEVDRQAVYLQQCWWYDA